MTTMHKFKTLKTITVFATGNTIAMLLGVIGSLVQARYVGPENLGIFRMFGILAGYLTFLHLGVFDGLQREIPLQLGRGNQEKAERAASACLWWILFISLICSLLFLTLALRAIFNQKWMEFWGWLSYIPFIIMTFYGGYLGTTFRTGQHFIALSNASVVQAIAGTLVLPLLPVIGYYGVCLRTAVGSATNLFLLHRWRPMRVHPCFNWSKFREVINIGLPLSGIGYLSTALWVSLEGSLIMGWFGFKALGLYSLAVFLRAMLMQMAQNINHVMNIKVYEQYGRSNRTNDCIHLIIRPTTVGLLSSIPLVISGWFLLPPLVNLLIPQYINAIPMMRLMLLTMPITLLSLPTSILWAAGKLFDCFISVIIGFLIFILSAFLFHNLHLGALGVIIASIIGQVLNIFVSYILILKLAVQEGTFLQNRKFLIQPEGLG